MFCINGKHNESTEKSLLVSHPTQTFTLTWSFGRFCGLLVPFYGLLYVLFNCFSLLVP